MAKNLTHNVDRNGLEEALVAFTKDRMVSGLLAKHLLEKYDVTEKPEPIGTVRVSYDPTGEDSVVYVRTGPGPRGWAAIYFGSGYERPSVYDTGRQPSETTGVVFKPSGS